MDKIINAVRERYAAGAQACESSLCCAVAYDPKYLKVIPPEVIERDYGCGDPSKYVRAGDVVLDLGSGGGKACFIAAQIVGAEGRVMGVDMTEEMLALAQSAAPRVAEALGYANVEFRRARIEDLAGAGIADASVDVVISNCVLNLVEDGLKPRLFREIARVLKAGGRVAVSDIVSDKPTPAHLKADPDLWSGCISGALTETEFLGVLVQAGLQNVTLAERAAEPWQVIEGIAYRSITVTAVKPGAAKCCAPGSCC